MLPDSGVASYVLGFDAGVDRDPMRQTITNLPGVVAYNDSKAFAATIDQYLGLFWVFGGVMIALGAVLALAVIYVTMAVNVVERTNELATLRAAGVPLRRVAGTIATESLVATALGLPFGLGLGVLAAKAFLASFSSDMFQFPRLAVVRARGRGRGRARRGGRVAVAGVASDRRVDVAEGGARALGLAAPGRSTLARLSWPGEAGGDPTGDDGRPSWLHPPLTGPPAPPCHLHTRRPRKRCCPAWTARPGG